MSETRKQELVADGLKYEVFGPEVTGRMTIRTATTETDTALSPIRSAVSTSVRWNQTGDETPVVLDTTPRECAACHGTGHEFRQLPETVRPVETIDDCPACDGVGYFRYPEVVEFNRRRFRGEDVARLTGEKNLRLVTPKEFDFTRPQRGLFLFDSGAALIDSLRPVVAEVQDA